MVKIHLVEPGLGAVDGNVRLDDVATVVDDAAVFVHEDGNGEALEGIVGDADVFAVFEDDGVGTGDFGLGGEDVVDNSCVVSTRQVEGPSRI